MATSSTITRHDPRFAAWALAKHAAHTWKPLNPLQRSLEGACGGAMGPHAC
jgi:hypothetical protein